MNDKTYLSAVRLVKEISEKSISSLDLLELTIEQYHQHNPYINAIIATDLDGARSRARKADKAISQGETWGPLHGLPMTVKDSLEVIGMPCAAGAPELERYIPEKNADAVDSLSRAGAIIFGKTNVPYLVQGFQTFNQLYGQTNNPWDTTRVPGGSSGGAAAALATGMSGLEIGSDIGGSVRIPAHFCGIYGHKPSFGIVPSKGHVPPFPGLFPKDFTMDIDILVIGPLARSAEDLDLAINLMTQPREPERIASNFKLPLPRKDRLKDFKIACWLDDPYCPVDTQVGDCLQATIDMLIRAGIQITEAHPDIDFGNCNDTYRKLKAAGMSASLSQEEFDYYRSEIPKIDQSDDSSRAQRFRGATISHREWLMLDYNRLLIQQKWADFFKEYDILLCPVAPVTAFPHDRRPFDEIKIQVNNRWKLHDEVLVSWVGLASVAYLPSTVAPIGLARNGLPVGIQIIGPYLEDRTSIRFVELMEDVTGGFNPPPES